MECTLPNYSQIVSQTLKPSINMYISFRNYLRYKTIYPETFNGFDEIKYVNVMDKSPVPVLNTYSVFLH